MSEIIEVFWYKMPKLYYIVFWIVLLLFILCIIFGWLIKVDFIKSFEARFTNPAYSYIVEKDVITEVFVKDNQQVAKGDKLYNKIDQSKSLVTVYSENQGTVEFVAVDNKFSDGIDILIKNNSFSVSSNDILLFIPDRYYQYFSKQSEIMVSLCKKQALVKDMSNKYFLNKDQQKIYVVTLFNPCDKQDSSDLFVTVNLGKETIFRIIQKTFMINNIN